MKTYIGFSIVALVFLVIGVTIMCSNWGGSTNYYADGKVLLNDEQWEQFKVDLISEPTINLETLQVLNGETVTGSSKRIRVLDWGKTKVVELDSIRVSPNFHYGSITSDFNKDSSHALQIIEVIAIALGEIIAVSVITCALCDYY
jgi:hypothetical protein